MVVDLGGYAVHNVSVLNDPSFKDSAALRGRLPGLAMDTRCMDFWQEPAPTPILLQAMQKRMHDYVVADQGTAQEALDASSIKPTGRKSSRTTGNSDGFRRTLTIPLGLSGFDRALVSAALPVFCLAIIR